MNKNKVSLKNKRIDGIIKKIEHNFFLVKDQNDSKEYKVKTNKDTIFVEVFLEKDSYKHKKNREISKNKIQEEDSVSVFIYKQEDVWISAVFQVISVTTGEEVSEKEVVMLWEKKLKKMKRGDIFNVYIDNPFCVRRCSYCKHSGSVLKENKKHFEYYYNKLLLKQINNFKELFDIKTPDTIYFGGGTANIISTKKMKDIFEAIPCFSKIPNKAFESNPNLLSDDQVELLINNKFSYVSLGIQSLNDKILSKNERKKCSAKDLKKYIKDFEDGGVRVSCDIMAFIGDKNGEEEIERVRKDIIELLENYKPSMITIYPETFFLKEDKKRGIKMSKELRKMILELSGKYSLSHFNKHLSLKDEDIGKTMETCYHIGTISESEMERVKKYDSTGPPLQRSFQNCLPFGGFAHHRPYGYHGKNLVYYNINEDNIGFSYYKVDFEKEKV